jgi:hypothetical protein
LAQQTKGEPVDLSMLSDAGRQGRKVATKPQ